MAFTIATKRAIDVGLPSALTALVAYFYIGKAKDREIKYILFVMILVFIGTYAVTTTITKLILEKAMQGLGSAGKAAVQTQYGLDAASYKKAEDIAKAVYAAWDFGSFGEDEAAAVDAMNRCDTTAEVKAACEIYNKLFSRQLKADFNSYLGGWNTWPKQLVQDSWF